MEFYTTGIKAIDMHRKFVAFKNALAQGSTVLMDKIGDEATKEMHERTAAGKDVNQKEFKPYSAKYAEWKRKKVGSSTPVNLKLHGDMLDAVKKQTTSKTCRVFVEKGLQWTKARVHNYKGRAGRGTGFSMPERRWFGVSSQKLIELKEMYKNYWRAVFQRTMGK